MKYCQKKKKKMTLQTSYLFYFVERDSIFIWTEELKIHFLRAGLLWTALLTIHAVFAHEDLQLPLKSVRVCQYVYLCIESP